MAFERFTESGKGFKPRISIRPSGTIGINDSALKRFGLKSQKYVALYFDAETKRIAIGIAQEDEQGAQRLNLAGKGASISAKRFLDYHDLGVKTTTQYECHFDEEQKLVILDREIRKREKRSSSESSTIARAQNV
jgi:hypothetical protein